MENGHKMKRACIRLCGMNQSVSDIDGSQRQAIRSYSYRVGSRQALLAEPYCIRVARF